MRERCADSSSFYFLDLTVSRGKTQVMTSGVDPDVVDIHNIYCAVLYALHVTQNVAVSLFGR